MLLSRVMNNVHVFRVITEMMVKLLKITEIGFTYYWNGLSVGWQLCVYSADLVICNHIGMSMIIDDITVRCLY